MVTKRDEMNINGGTPVRLSKRTLRITNRFGLAFLLVLTLAGSGFAQGSIFGTVSNSNATTPANGEVLFVGYLDNTDEEIRIESSDGAGYDAGNWFDDFQNYLTEAPGNPYDYHFYNVANNQGFQLSGAIPNNSFQQENVTLAAVTWPVAPIGLTGVTVSGTGVALSWTRVSGLTYHVYRRVASSNGSFFRIDNTAGSLANPGVASNYFVDNTASGGGAYSYIIIAQDPSSNFSPHSSIVTVNTASVDAPLVTTINPSTGTATGGTLVTVNGSGFDPAGATVNFGVTSVVATVISPFQLTVTTPAGSVGASRDISVTNTSSLLSSNILIGAFIYAANTPPVLATIGPRTVVEHNLLTFATSATDVDGNTPIMTASVLPSGATYVANGSGGGTFSWTPSYTQAGIYNVTFYATDGVVSSAIDSEVVNITVTEAGNQNPVVAAIVDQTVAEAQTLTFTVSATDADLDPIGLSAAPLPTNASFTDNGDGTGSFTFTPDFTQAGIYNVVFTAIDTALNVGSTTAHITVTNVNQLPTLAAIGAQGGTENVQFSFRVSASDPDGVAPILTTSTLPGSSVFVDSLNGAGSFTWTPNFASAGSYNVVFRATDRDVSSAIDSEIVTITIVDAGNQAPVLAAIGAHTVTEGATLGFTVTATDVDGTTPSFSAEGLPTNATLVDNVNGSANFSFTPDFTQAGSYNVRFIASDGVLTDSELVVITVTESGNIAPVFAAIGDFIVNEGDSLVVTVTATDADGGSVYPALSVSTTLEHFTFVDNHNGTGRLVYRPNYYSSGLDTINFFATDYGTPQRTTTAISAVTTVEVNQAPAFVQVPAHGVAVGDSLIFTIQASDSTDPVSTHRVILSGISLPSNATFVDNGNSTGRFTFVPSITQVGLNQVTFLGVDQGTPQLSSTMTVNITVVTENAPPVLAAIGPRTIREGQTLTINLSATDPDGVIPALQVVGAPLGSTFVDNGDGTAVFTYIPLYYGTQRLVSVTFRAFDGYAIDKELVLIQVYDAGNQRPYFDSIPTPSVIEGETFVQGLTASDADSNGITMSIVAAQPLPLHASFLDLAAGALRGRGLGAITFSPDFTQSGTYDIDVVVSDGTLADTITVTFTVIEFGNHAPTMTNIADQTMAENGVLTFGVVTSDLDGDVARLWTSTLPANATFTDGGSGSGTFTFNPDYTQAGSYDLTFYAADETDTSNQVVNITVTDVNQVPFISIGTNSVSMFERDTLIYNISSMDPDGPTPYLSAHLSGADTLATNMTVIDNRDGTGVLRFVPSWTQGGLSTSPTRYYVVFRCTDSAYQTSYRESETVTIRVTDRNVPPDVVFPLPGGPGPYTRSEGTTLHFYIMVIDLDATTAPSLRAENVPSTNATFSYTPADRVGEFSFAPDFTQAGAYSVRFIATDDRGAVDTAIVEITVLEAGNQAPTFGAEVADTLLVPSGHLYQIAVNPTDPEGDSVTVTAAPMLPGATWTSSGDGTWVYSFTADSTEVGTVYAITFVVTDYPGQASSTLVTHPRVVAFLRGDLDSDNVYSVNDIAYFVEYLFRDGPEPVVPDVADIDASGSVSISDISYLIYYMFRNGPQPAP
jgi:hypothetical protein